MDCMQFLFFIKFKFKFKINLSIRAKSKLTNVRAYCSACVDPISIIFLDMSWISYSFEEYIKLNLKWVHFFRMNVHFRIFLVFGWYLSHFRILHYVWPLVIRDPWKNGVAIVSDSRDMRHNVFIHYVGSVDWVPLSSDWATSFYEWNIDFYA